MAQSGLSEKAAAKKAFKHLWKNFDPAVVALFTIETGITQGLLRTYYKDSPKASLMEVPAILRDIFTTLEEDEEGDISLSASVTAWQKNYGPRPASHCKSHPRRLPPQKAASSVRQRIISLGTVPRQSVNKGR
jgi:hypothetical protein